MTPIVVGRGRQERRVLTAEEQNYNRRFADERMLIERCNGVLKMRFRCILNERHLRYESVKVARFVYSCVTLHNFLILNNFNILHDINENELQEVIRVQHAQNQANQFANVQIPNDNVQRREGQMRQQQLINVLNALPPLR